MPGPERSAAELVVAARGGEARALGRLLSWVEESSPRLVEVMALLAPLGARAQVIGVTGAPGVGKSTTTSALITAFRERGQRVGVLAVDPSSPFSGGALLGDRIRMTEHGSDPGVFIRSLATRGRLGGLAGSTPQSVRVLDAAGFDVVIIETVGVGQSELDVAALADTVLVLLAPGMGDGIQAAKAGILEIADVLVVNKSDRPGAEMTARELRLLLATRGDQDGEWRPPVLATVASRSEGIAEVLGAIDTHCRWMAGSGQLAARRTLRASAEIEQIALDTLRRLVGGSGASGVESELGQLAGRVSRGELDPYAAAAMLVRRVVDGLGGAAMGTVTGP